ncbi:predicted protein [Sclerotinia sclerotiorum 1980 UF-70]|uniref:Uncharacterized protein n=1 Tax=Sclerotinia sclerotiorum (strain ATCC 18683 / 1980 / Ss-1) TaxID=665079 RepID=A7EN36_SCLS1|nr:predicted protein [Sclerotinia sclerotiorum 1980 UF-70]EDO04252.1 predicted protein [Sclerotinia sclerotiorum 1980 UF-70]
MSRHNLIFTFIITVASLIIRVGLISIFTAIVTTVMVAMVLLRDIILGVRIIQQIRLCLQIQRLPVRFTLDIGIKQMLFFPALVPFSELCPEWRT